MATSHRAPVAASHKIYLVIWSGGYEAPSMHAFTNMKEAEAKFEAFRRDSRDSSDNIAFVEQQVQADGSVVIRTLDEFFPGIDDLTADGVPSEQVA